MKRFAPTTLALGLCAATALAFGAARITAQPMMPVQPAALAQAPDTGEIALRMMAEIDNDPTTFTADEQRKHVVLAQVLGTSPLSIMDTFHLIES